MYRFIMVTLLVFGLAACGGDNETPTACTSTEVDRLHALVEDGGWSEYIAAVRGVRDMNAAQLAAARDGIESARETVESEDWSPCGEDIKAKLLDSMDSNITGIEKALNGDGSAIDDIDRGQAEYLEANTLISNLEPD